MDFPVEATVHLDHFADEREVRKLLMSHHFVLADLGEGRVRVNGYFSDLKAVKARLEQLTTTQTKTNSRQPVPTASSGAISKYYNKGSRTSGSLPRNGPVPSRSKFPNSASLDRRHFSQEYRSPFPPQPSSAIKGGSESFSVDADIYRYADQLRKTDVDTILIGHNVELDVLENDDSFTITLKGKNSKTAAAKLQSLLLDLNKTLRTQEVLRKEMDREGEAFLERIQKHRNIYDYVLVRATNDRLHLIGPSSQSYQLKQKLLEKAADQSPRTGRNQDRSFRPRSSSEPAANRKTAEGQRAAADDPPLRGASGYTPPNHQDIKQKASRSRPPGGLERLAASFRKRSSSVSSPKKAAQRANRVAPERENTQLSPKSPSKSFFKDIWKNLKKK